MTDYFLSLCIANFGVEPSLASLFFLFLPAFFSLNFLLHLVCIVLDAITISLRFYIFKIRSLYLSRFLLFVKIFLISANYSTSYAIAANEAIKDIFIGKGEQLTIDAQSLTHYSVGNKEVIKSIFRSKEKKIYIKGKSIGFSDLVIWSGKNKLTYHIYVSSKREQLKKLKNVETLKRIGLNVSLEGDYALVTGVVDSLRAYLAIQKITSLKSENLVFDISLSKKVRNSIFERTYSSLYKFGASKVICKNLKISIYCSVDGIDLKDPVVKELEAQLFISFDREIDHFSDKNYLAKFKIIQVESMDDRNIKVGLSKLSSPLINLIQGKHLSLIEGESINVSELNIKATLLSEPQAVITLNSKASLSLGGEIPVTTTSTIGQNTQWKFYGLKIKTLLSKKNGKPFLSYESTLTTPRTDTIEGTKGKAGLYVKLNKYSKLFEIGHSFDQSKLEGIPYLNKIPFLKYLFSGTSHSRSYKHIICYINVEDSRE